MAKPTKKPSGSRQPAVPPKGPASASQGPMLAAIAGLALVLAGLAGWIATRDKAPPPAPPAATEKAPTTSAPPPSLTPPPATERPKPPSTQKPPAPTVSEAPKPATEPEPEPETEVRTPAPKVEHATAWPRGPTEPAKVVRCIDGDTVELQDGRRLRLVGINTPEKDRPLYGDAKALLKRLVEGRDVTIEWDKDRVDQYKRNLGYLHLDDLFVNGEIVRQGLAYCYTWEPNTAHHDEFITFQRQARTAKAGLWGLAQPAPESVYAADRTGHRFHRPSCGRVARIKQRIDFKSRDEALDAGQNPCDECNP